MPAGGLLLVLQLVQVMLLVPGKVLMLVHNDRGAMYLEQGDYDDGGLGRV